MTSDPRKQQSGPEFEQDLETVSAAWSGLEQTEPPELLNQAVVNTARRELDARRRSRPLRWLGGFATATVIVLALTIVIQQDEQQTAPALKKTDSFKLEQRAPEASETRMKRSAATPPIAASDTAALPVAEEINDSLAEKEEAPSGIPAAEAWIERLLHLRNTRQDEKLVQELAAFREAYPDHPLPPELQD